MILGHVTPRMTDYGRRRLELALETGCTGWDCPNGDRGALTRRIISAAVQIHLQCLGCGKSVCGAMARKDHYFWQSYSEWDENLVARTAARAEQKRQVEAARVDAIWKNAEAVKASQAAEIASYAEWCRTSPEWHRIRGRVLWRSRGICEACLTEPATTVHHLTYDHGKLPPAWNLRSVCQKCHNRLHASGDDWCARGMERFES